MRRYIVFFLFTLALFAEDNRYSILRLKNETSHSVSYHYHWGSGSLSSANTLKPGQVYLHWWKFEHVNQNHAPWFYLRIDGDNRIYHFKSFFSPDTHEWGGRVYWFSLEDGKVVVVELNENDDQGIFFEQTN